MVQLQKRYSLGELLSACNPGRAQSAEERAWIDLVPFGREDEIVRMKPEASGGSSERKTRGSRSR